MEQSRQGDGCWLIGQSVFFRIGDLFHPSPTETLCNTTPGLVVSGKILYFTDSDDQIQRFAVLEVDGIPGNLVVPVAKLMGSSKSV